MFLEFFGKGILMGIVASIPLGAISILVIQRTINRGRMAGFFSGLGIAFCDVIYASAAGLSMTLLIDFINKNESIFKLVGSIVIFALGVFIFFSSPKKRNIKRSPKNSHVKDFGSAFILAFSNPLVIFLHLAIFSSFRVVLSLDKPKMTAIVLIGFFLGALLWWLVVSKLVSLFSHKFNDKIYLWFNRIAGAVIIVFVIVSTALWLFTDYI